MPTDRRRSTRATTSRKRRQPAQSEAEDDSDDESAPPVSKSRPSKRRQTDSTASASTSLQQRIKTLEAELTAARRDTSTVEHELEAERTRVSELEAQLAPQFDIDLNVPTSPSMQHSFDFGGPDDPFEDMNASTSILSAAGTGRTSSPPTSPQRNAASAPMEMLKTVLGMEEDEERSMADLVGVVGERLKTADALVDRQSELEKELQSSHQCVVAAEPA